MPQVERLPGFNVPQVESFHYPDSMHHRLEDYLIFHMPQVESFYYPLFVCHRFRNYPVSMYRRLRHYPVFTLHTG